MNVSLLMLTMMVVMFTVMMAMTCTPTAVSPTHCVGAVFTVRWASAGKLLRFLLEVCFAVVAAEVKGLPLIFEAEGLFFINYCATDRVKDLCLRDFNSRKVYRTRRIRGGPYRKDQTHEGQ